ncbi:hypothetical protein [Mycolicibacterium setense]
MLSGDDDVEQFSTVHAVGPAAAWPEFWALLADGDSPVDVVGVVAVEERYVLAACGTWQLRGARGKFGEQIVQAGHGMSPQKRIPKPPLRWSAANHGQHSSCWTVHAKRPGAVSVTVTHESQSGQAVVC